MAFRLGSDSYDVEETPIVAEINITPLTDVFLVLLIIFMVTTSVMSQMGVNVTLPKSSQSTSTSKAVGIIVTVTKDGSIKLNNVAVPRESLQAQMTEMLAKTTEKTVVLEGDKEAVLGTVVEIMDEAKKAGATKFAVATQGTK